MAPIDEPASSKGRAAPKSPRKAEARPDPAEQPASGDLVAFTMDVATGRIVKVEFVEKSGERHEISEEERKRLASVQAKASLQRIIEQAFEAGIDCVLNDDGETVTPESEEEAELSRVLLRSLIEHSAAKPLMRRDTLARAIVGTLIEQAAIRPPEGAATH